MSDGSGFPPVTGGDTNGGGKLATATKFLIDANALVSQFGPLVGTSILTVKMMIALLKSQGVDVASFEVEAGRLEGELTKLQSSIDEFNAKYPRPVEPGI